MSTAVALKAIIIMAFIAILPIVLLSKLPLFDYHFRLLSVVAILSLSLRRLFLVQNAIE